MRAAVIGDACIDVYADGRSYSTGNAVDTAVHLGQLGTPTTLVTVVGADGAGARLLHDIADAGLSIDHIRREPGATAITHMDMLGTERIHGAYAPGVLDEYAFTPEEVAYCASHDLVHSAYWGGMQERLAELRVDGASISFDFADRAGDPLERAACEWVDYGFYSFTEDTDEVRSFLRDRHNSGMRCAVGTLGERGSIAFDGEFRECGIVKAEVINTVGAGDAFIAGFLHGLLTGATTSECLQGGAEVAANVISIFEPFSARRL